jgi:hypothetical protein
MLRIDVADCAMALRCRIMPPSSYLPNIVAAAPYQPPAAALEEGDRN